MDASPTSATYAVRAITRAAGRATPQPVAPAMAHESSSSFPHCVHTAAVEGRPPTLTRTQMRAPLVCATWRERLSERKKEGERTLESLAARLFFAPGFAAVWKQSRDINVLQPLQFSTILYVWQLSIVERFPKIAPPTP
jgi:hypothetical protein